MTFYPYSFGGKKGIGCGLGPVQKLKDGEVLGGGHVSAAQAFGAPQQPAAQNYAAGAGMPQQPMPGINPITGRPF